MDPDDTARPAATHPPGPVISSAHLADSALPAPFEVELALAMANHAFQRWIVR